MDTAKLGKVNPGMVWLVWALSALLSTTAGAQDVGWVVTTDYSNFGRLRNYDLSESWTVSADLATIPGDAVARHHDGLLYVVGRGGSNVLQVYDPAAGMGLVREFSLGAGRNLQDIAFDAAGEAYVSCYDQAVLLRVDVPAETILESYSTAAYADADGLPETSWLRMVGDRLYITCQKLDRQTYAPTGPGQLLVFDTVGEFFDAPIDLVGANPYTQLEAVSDGHGGTDLRVGCFGVFGLIDGGIERVDLNLGESLGFDVTGAELGGDVSAFVTTGGAIHALVSPVPTETSLRRYNPATGQLSVLAASNSYVHADIAFDGDFQLFVADRTTGASGLRVFDTASGAELTTTALPTGLKPFMIVLPEPDQISSVPGTPITGSLVLAAPFPNPCNPSAELELAGPVDDTIEITIYDLRGRRISGDRLRLGPAGRNTWVFAGIDERGRNLPAGVYRVVAQSKTGFAAQSVTLIK